MTGGFCPNCVAARTGQRFCATCGNGFWRTAAGQPAAAPSQPVTPGAGAKPKPSTGGRALRWAVFIVVALIVIGGISELMAPKSTGPSVSSADVPPVGDIWFGSSFDPNTLALSGKEDSVGTQAAFAMVAHLPRSLERSVAHLAGGQRQRHW